MPLNTRSFLRHGFPVEDVLGSIAGRPVGAAFVLEGTDRRRQILKFVESHPGCYFRQVKRALGMSTGALQYHLEVLEKKKSIVSQTSGFFRRFYPPLFFGEQDQAILAVLSQETERDILLFLVQNPGTTQTEVSAYVHISAPSVNWHIKRLTRCGLVRATHKGHYVVYDMCVNRRRILELLRTYHTGIWQRWANRLSDILTEISNQ